LAHDPSESSVLARLLSEAAAHGKQVVLLSGDVHQRPRCGQLNEAAAASEGPSQPVWVLESGALGEPITDVVPAGWLTPSGTIELQLVPRY
jgi:hypothetical protein